MSEKALVPVEQRDVIFYGDSLTAVRVEDGTILIPVRPICDSLGISWNGQRERINRDAVLSDVVMSVRVTRADIDPSSRAPRSSTMLCLPLDYLNGWMFGINANRVKPALRERVIQYQRDCYRVLSDAFREGRLTIEQDLSDILTSESPSAVAYRMAAAVMNIARQQYFLEKRVDAHEDRLERLEAQLGHSAAHISDQQASQISQAVKAIALELSKQTKRNEYGGVYGELYRRFGITSYKLLPAGRFDEAMGWLTEWYGSVTNSPDGLPF